MDAKFDRQQPLSDLFTPDQWRVLARECQLTKRQVDVAQAICRELSNREIAAELGLAYDTIRMHVRELLHRLAVQSRVGVPIRLVLVLRRLYGD